MTDYWEMLILSTALHPLNFTLWSGSNNQLLHQWIIQIHPSIFPKPDSSTVSLCPFHSLPNKYPKTLLQARNKFWNCSLAAHLYLAFNPKAWTISNQAPSDFKKKSIIYTIHFSDSKSPLYPLATNIIPNKPTHELFYPLCHPKWHSLGSCPASLLLEV